MTDRQTTLIKLAVGILLLFAVIRLLDWLDLRPELKENLMAFALIALFLTAVHYHGRAEALKQDLRWALERRDAGNSPLLRPGASPEPNKIYDAIDEHMQTHLGESEAEFRSFLKGLRQQSPEEEAKRGNEP